MQQVAFLNNPGSFRRFKFVPWNRFYEYDEIDDTPLTIVEMVRAEQVWIKFRLDMLLRKYERGEITGAAYSVETARVVSYSKYLAECIVKSKFPVDWDEYRNTYIPDVITEIAKPHTLMEYLCQQNANVGYGISRKMQQVFDNRRKFKEQPNRVLEKAYHDFPAFASYVMNSQTRRK